MGSSALASAEPWHSRLRPMALLGWGPAGRTAQESTDGHPGLDVSGLVGVGQEVGERLGVERAVRPPRGAEGPAELHTLYPAPKPFFLWIPVPDITPCQPLGHPSPQTPGHFHGSG